MKNNQRSLMNNSFVVFIKNNTLLVYFSIFLLLLTYGIKIVNTNYAVDTIWLMTDSDSNLLWWESLGRAGLVVLKRALTEGYVNIYLLNFLTLSFHLLSSLLVCYLVQIVTKIKNSSFILFIIPAIYMTHPFFSSQFYFVLQSFEFTLGTCLVIFSAILIYLSYKNEGKKWLNRTLATLFLFIAFSIYQSLIPFFIAITVSIVLFHVLSDSSFNITIKSYFNFILPYISAFVIGLISSQLFNKLMMRLDNVTETQYLNGRITWGEKPILEIINSIWNEISVQVFPPITDPFMTSLLGIELVLLIIVLTIMSIRKKPYIFLTLFHYMALFVVPFAILILQGGTLVNPHSQVPTYPYVLAIILVSLFILIDPKFKSISYFITAIAILFLFLQVRTTSNLLFSDQMKFEEDIRVTQRLVNQIDSLQLENQSDYSLLLVGGRYSKNLSTEPANIMGLSLYVYGSFSPLAVSKNVINFMNTLGYTFQDPTQEQYDQIINQTDAMNIFPDGGSIKVIDKLIIVKLS
ncbi:conserved membrane hypothetical protein [Carnobacterium maltaromaticum]|uniref:glucosyltransferase domain-containing protein n=1 Tax=Carnobacterium maltaromaticum TaxID=2751 RepID=UPI00191BCA70|nr:glucosyltransferase domain-containing protein [Carnobacterium maltaromaticum]CAD5900162.1 conserved membrane hypothetical protein [Carnobacterium maltaromaticum]CAD5902682.1 conserved membrane hypothetical protein [Carnobacterium maltaromaticum]